MTSKLYCCETNVNYFEYSLTKQEVLENLANRLLVSGLVRNSFPQAIKDREIVFPTGLPTEPIGVAIPHTDFEHVVSNSIAIGLLKNPVEFVEMGSADGRLVKIYLVMMLAIAEKDTIIPVLRKVITILKNSEILRNIQSVRNSSDLYCLIKQEFEELIC